MRPVAINRSGVRWTSCGIALIAMVIAIADGTAYAQSFGPLTRADFRRVAPQGFGDRQNGWAWSMEWFAPNGRPGKLYVGSNRAYHCVETASIKNVLPFWRYPPPDPDIECAPDPNDLPLRAEIWAWTPETSTWARVYRSPEDIPIVGAPGKFVAADIGYRGMSVFTEADGTQALYVSGLSGKALHPGSPGGRLLRSVDGVTFEPVPQPPGTFLGDLDNGGFRGSITYDGRFFIIAGTILGSGALLESSDPKTGGDSFRQVTPAGMEVWETAVFNGWLYLGLAGVDGFSVVKTNAQPHPVTGQYNYIPVIRKGGERPVLPNRDALSMKVFKGRLYVGGNGMRSSFGAELYRINPDDTWDLVHGQPRLTSAGFKRPISRLGPGFGWPMNAHMWRMEVFDNRLYVGTFDLSTSTKNIGLIRNLLARDMGADLWVSTDGVFFTPITETGFEDRFNFGMRSLKATPRGLFLGTANYYYGLQVFRAVPFGWGGPLAGSARARTVAAPRVDVERVNGAALLTWGEQRNVRYRVFRARSGLDDLFASIASSPGFEAALLELGLGDPLADIGDTLRQHGLTDTVSALTFVLNLLGLSDAGSAAGHGFEEIGVTSSPHFVDVAAGALGNVAYYVRAEDPSGQLRASESNRVRLTTALPPTTFASVRELVVRLALRKQFTSQAVFEDVALRLKAAEGALLKGDSRELVRLHQDVRKNRWMGHAILTSASAEELEIELARLVNRSRVAKAGIIALEQLR